LGNTYEKYAGAKFMRSELSSLRLYPVVFIPSRVITFSLMYASNETPLTASMTSARMRLFMKEYENNPTSTCGLMGEVMSSKERPNPSRRNTPIFFGRIPDDWTDENSMTFPIEIFK